ncbi:MAG: InlB B-repeat-containing protein [Flavobacteriaceae bacterium]|nr:InlB B-repeat-containing protein [Flavobacteriaceae bacterium]
MKKQILSVQLFAFGLFLIAGCSTEEQDSNIPTQIEQPSIVETPQYSLNVTTSEGGTVSTDGGTYDEGTAITITATPDEGYEFTGWEGVDSEEASLTITLNEDQTLNALFSPVVSLFTITVTAAEGGSVSTAGGTFEEGTEIEITATPEQGYEFSGWVGNDSVETTLSITLSSALTLQALFEEIQTYTLTVSSVLGGSVSTQGGEFPEGTTVSIIAMPEEGYQFNGWDGNDSLETTITVTMTSDLELTPLFTVIISEEDNSPEVSDSGPVYWQGTTLSFVKEDNADPTVEINQDRLTSTVWITRGNGGGQIYNAAVSENADKVNSPVGTEWAIGILDDVSSLSFGPFRATVSKPKNVVGKNLVVHLIKDDVYLSLKFTSWSGGKKGGFSYERSTP